jgi:hypothetical protein
MNSMVQVERNSLGKFNRLNFEVSCDLCYATCMKCLHAYPHEWTRASQLALCTSGLSELPQSARGEPILTVDDMMELNLLLL